MSNHPEQPLNLEVLNALLSEEVADTRNCTNNKDTKCPFCQWVDQVAASDVQKYFGGYQAFHLTIPNAPILSVFALSCQMLRIGMKYSAAVRESSFLDELERMK